MYNHQDGEGRHEESHGATSSNISVVPNGGIFEVFKAIDRGDFVLDMEEKAKALVEAIGNTGKGGKLSVEIEIAPHKESGVVFVSGKVKAKIPESKPKAAVFFVTPENNLSRYDSRQRDMFGQQ